MASTSGIVHAAQAGKSGSTPEEALTQATVNKAMRKLRQYEADTWVDSQGVRYYLNHNPKGDTATCSDGKKLIRIRATQYVR